MCYLDAIAADIAAKNETDTQQEKKSQTEEQGQGQEQPSEKQFRNLK